MAPSMIDKEILRLQQEREKLLARREVVKHETLQSMADAFARKLQAAGLTVREGIQALRPYEHVRLSEALAARPTAGSGTRVVRRTPVPDSVRSAPVATQVSSVQDSVEAHAQQVLGAGWKEWLDQPNLLLGGERPNALLGHRAGVAKVRALLEAFGHAS